MSLFKARVYSAAMRRYMYFNVCLPLDDIELPGAPKQEKKDCFETVFLLHGHGGNHDDWLMGCNLDYLALKFNMAFVMPSVENSFYIDDEPHEALYATYVCEELLTLVRKTFPLSSRREDTAIAGLSMGGFGALRLGLLYPDVFDGIIALSSALITDEIAALPKGQGNTIASYAYYEHIFGPLSALKGSDRDPKALARTLATAKPHIPKIFMACGTEDFLLENNRDYDRYLTGLEIPHTYLEGPGEHVWKFFDEYIEKGLEWWSKSKRETGAFLV